MSDLPAGDPGAGAGTSSRRLVVKTTAGADAPERCNQALTVAATAAAAGVPVSLWLTGEATRLAVRGAEGFVLDAAQPPVELLQTVVELGEVVVCTSCAQRRGITEGDLRQGVRIAGAASFVEQVVSDATTALVY